MTGEEEEDLCPGALAAFSPFVALTSTSVDSLAQAALGGWNRGISTGTSVISLPLGGITFGPPLRLSSSCKSSAYNYYLGKFHMRSIQMSPK